MLLYALLVSKNEAGVRVLASTGLPARAWTSGRFAADVYRSGTERGAKAFRPVRPPPPSGRAAARHGRRGEAESGQQSQGPTTAPIGMVVYVGDVQSIHHSAERDHANIVRWSEFDRGGHHAAHHLRPTS